MRVSGEPGLAVGLFQHCNSGIYRVMILLQLLCFLLEKQETEELELYQAARLTYFTAKGVILDYDGETAIFADSLTEPGWMTVYSQKPGSDREELLRVPVSYAGSGAGRFMANGKLYYADESRIYEYDFAGEPRLLVDAEQPIISMNYLFYDHDKLCVGALTKYKLKSIRIDENYAIESTLCVGCICHGKGFKNNAKEFYISISFKYCRCYFCKVNCRFRDHFRGDRIYRYHCTCDYIVKTQKFDRHLEQVHAMNILT